MTSVCFGAELGCKYIYIVCSKTDSLLISAGKKVQVCKHFAKRTIGEVFKWYFIADEAMRLLVQAILSISGESKKPELQDCLAVRGKTPRSHQDCAQETDSRYMVEYSQQYLTDETYSHALPQSKNSRCCPG